MKSNQESVDLAFTKKELKNLRKEIEAKHGKKETGKIFEKDGKKFMLTGNKKDVAVKQGEKWVKIDKKGNISKISSPDVAKQAHNQEVKQLLEKMNDENDNFYCDPSIPACVEAQKQYTESFIKKIEAKESFKYFDKVEVEAQTICTAEGCSKQEARKKAVQNISKTETVIHNRAEFDQEIDAFFMNRNIQAEMDKAVQEVMKLPFASEQEILDAAIKLTANRISKLYPNAEVNVNGKLCRILEYQGNIQTTVNQAIEQKKEDTRTEIRKTLPEIEEAVLETYVTQRLLPLKKEEVVVQQKLEKLKVEVPDTPKEELDVIVKAIKKDDFKTFKEKYPDEKFDVLYHKVREENYNIICEGNYLLCEPIDTAAPEVFYAELKENYDITTRVVKTPETKETVENYYYQEDCHEVIKTTEKNTNAVRVKRCQTLSGIIKSFPGIDLNSPVEYRDQRVKVKQIAKHLNSLRGKFVTDTCKKCDCKPETFIYELFNKTDLKQKVFETHLILPGQYIWVENGKVIIDNKAPEKIVTKKEVIDTIYTPHWYNSSGQEIKDSKKIEELNNLKKTQNPQEGDPVQIKTTETFETNSTVYEITPATQEKLQKLIALIQSGKIDTDNNAFQINVFGYGYEIKQDREKNKPDAQKVAQPIIDYLRSQGFDYILDKNDVEAFGQKSNGKNEIEINFVDVENGNEQGVPIRYIDNNSQKTVVKEYDINGAETTISTQEKSAEKMAEEKNSKENNETTETKETTDEKEAVDEKTKTKKQKSNAKLTHANDLDHPYDKVNWKELKFRDDDFEIAIEDADSIFGGEPTINSVLERINSETELSEDEATFRDLCLNESVRHFLKELNKEGVREQVGNSTWLGNTGELTLPLLKKIARLNVNFDLSVEEGYFGDTLNAEVAGGWKEFSTFEDLEKILSGEITDKEIRDQEEADRKAAEEKKRLAEEASIKEVVDLKTQKENQFKEDATRDLNDFFSNKYVDISFKNNLRKKMTVNPDFIIQGETLEGGLDKISSFLNNKKRSQYKVIDFKISQENGENKISRVELSKTS